MKNSPNNPGGMLPRRSESPPPTRSENMAEMSSIFSPAEYRAGKKKNTIRRTNASGTKKLLFMF